MQDVFYIDDLDQATTLLKPIRLEILQQLDEPRTCPELGDFFDESPQKIYYHIKALQNAGLVDRVSEKRVRGAVEGYYQARARSYWLAPQLVGKVGSQRMAQDQVSLRVLLDLTEEMQDEVGRLGHRAEAGQDVPSLSLSAHIHLPDLDRRAAFLEEVQQVFTALATKYGLGDSQDDGEGYRLILVCYPKKE